MKRGDFLRIPATALGVMIVNVGLMYAMVWVYATLIEAGQTQAYYEAYATRAAPISSVVAGIPLMLLAGYWLARGRQRRPALLAAGAAAILYLVIDLTILIAVQASGSIWVWVAFSNATKLAAAVAGAMLAVRRSRPASAAAAPSAQF